MVGSPPRRSDSQRAQRRPSNARGKKISWCYSIIGYAGQMGAGRGGGGARRRGRGVLSCGTRARRRRRRFRGRRRRTVDQPDYALGHHSPAARLGRGAQVDGVIDAFLVDGGQEVYQGQVLARIGSQGLESSRDAASSAVEQTQSASTGPRPPWLPRAWSNPARTPKRNAPVCHGSRGSRPFAPAVALQPGRDAGLVYDRHRGNTTARGPSSR